MSLRNGGFTDQEVDQWKAQAADQLQQGGFSAQEIRDYFGQKNFDGTDVKAQVQQNLAQAQPQQPQTKTPHEPIDADPKPVEAQNVWDAMAAGWGNSVLGLMLNKSKSPLALPKDAGVVQTAVSQGGQVLGDLPFMMAGSVVGQPFGAAAGAAVGGIGGIPAGMAAGSAAGAYAVPAAMRKILIDHYDNGDISSAKDFANRVVGTTWETAKAAITGAVTGPVGGVVGKAVGKIAGPAVQTVARLEAENLAQATVSSALEGRLPEKRDIINSAVSVLGLHAAGMGVGALSGVAKKIGNIYANTGALPEEIAESASRGDNVAFKQDLATDNDNLPKEAMLPAKTALQEQGAKTAAEAEAAAPSQITDSAQKILGKIGEEPDRPKQSVSDKFAQIYAKELNYNQTIKSFLTEAKGDDFLKENPENAYTLGTLNNGVMDKVKEFMEVGTRDFKTGETNGEPLMNIINDTKKAYGDEGPDIFNAVRLARRALNYDSRGIESGLDLDAAKQTIADYPDMSKIVDRYAGFRSRLIDYVAASGRYSQDSIAAMKEVAGNDYAPMNRIFEPDPVTGQYPGDSRTIKEVTGSDRDIRNPFISDMKTVGNLIKLAHQTEASNQLIKDVYDPENPSDLIKVSDNQSGNASKTQIEGWEDGKRTLYDVPEEVATAINAMSGNRPAMGVWTSLLNSVLKPFTVAQRGLTVNNPLFAIGHGWKQQWTAPTLSQTGLKLFQAVAYSPEYLMGKYGLDDGAAKSYHDFVYNGGAVNEMVKLDEDYLSKKIYENDPDTTTYGRVWNTVKDYSAATHWAITTHDNIIRFAEYQRMLDKGATQKEAAFAARQVLPDFQRQGYARSAYLNWIAFLPAHLQGLSRATEAASQDVSNFKKVISCDMDLGEGIKTLGTGYFAKALAMFTTTSLLVKLSQQGDDELDDVNNFQKNNYWLLHMHNWKEANLPQYLSVSDTYPSAARQMPDGSYQTDQGWFLRLPKPFATGTFFGSGVEAAIDAWSGKNQNAWRDFAKAMFWQVVPGEGLPVAGQPILQAMTNENYTEKPIVSARAERFLPEYQYNNYTSETAKLIAQMTSYVPGVANTKMSSAPIIDNTIKTWGGTMGQLAIDQLDKALIASGVSADKVEPLSKLNKIPLLSRFMVQFPTASPQSVIDFDERYKKADQVQNTVKMLMQSGDIDQAIKVQNRYQVNMDRLQGVEVSIQRMNGAIHKIDALSEKDMPRDQKQQLEESLMMGMAQIAKQGNKLMDEFEKGNK